MRVAGLLDEGGDVNGIKEFHKVVEDAACVRLVCNRYLCKGSPIKRGLKRGLALAACIVRGGVLRFPIVYGCIAL